MSLLSNYINVPSCKWLALIGLTKGVVDVMLQDRYGLFPSYISSDRLEHCLFGLSGRIVTAVIFHDILAATSRLLY